MSEKKDFPIESALVLGNARLACGYPENSNDSAGLRSAAKAKRISLVFEKNKQGIRKNSSCDGLRMAAAHFEKLCTRSGTSAHLKQYARSRNWGVEFSEVTVLELIIMPHNSGGTACASFKSLRLS